MPLLAAAVLCAACWDSAPTVAPPRSIPRFDAAPPATFEGCTRLWIGKNPTPTNVVVETDPSIGGCGGLLRVALDGSATFDPATGTVRIPVKLDNQSDSRTLYPAVRIAYQADSAGKYLNGTPISGTADLRGYGDSTSVDNRVSVWRLDTLLAPSGQTQVLPTMSKSQRVWLEFRSSDWTVAYRFPLYASAALPQMVPAVAPDTVPETLMDSLGIIRTFSGDSVWRDMLEVVFAPSATTTQRQSAISSIAGTVVGGVRWFQGDGSYYVHISANGSYDQLLRAAETLQSFPFVDLASPIFRGPLKDDAYRKPTDGTGWTHADWTVNKSLASGANWALEAINAPLAWGCETGNSAVKVSVVDRLFSNGISVPDVDANVTAYFGLPVVGTGTFHGQRIASVIGARGDNNSGMTGVMWRASIEERSIAERPDDYSKPDTVTGRSRYTNLARHLINAGMAGARIINLSQAAPWRAIAPGRMPDTTRTDSVGRADRQELSVRERTMRLAITRLATQGIQPLFVLAAGNDSLDATFSGFTRAKDLFPNQILVVGGIRPDRTSWPHSNVGRLVDVLAPAEQVAVTQFDGTVGSADGTSYAAPLVAGALGLLMSFDGASITAARMKQLLLAGVTDSVADAAGVSHPVLNVYAALKEAAKRPGAPLCGNRIWTDGSSIVVERGTATETIVGSSPGSVLEIFPHHGGRAVEYDGTPGTPLLSASWQSTGTWASTPSDGSIAEFTAGSAGSAFQRSHPSIGQAYGDSAIYVHLDNTPVMAWHVYLVLPDESTVLLATFPENVGNNAVAAYPMTGDTAVVAFNQWSGSMGGSYTLSSSSAYKVSIRASGQTPLPYWTENARGILALGLSEDDREIAVSFATILTAQQTINSGCSAEWRSFDAPRTLKRTVPLPGLCWFPQPSLLLTGGTIGWGQITPARVRPAGPIRSRE